MIRRGWREELLQVALEGDDASELLEQVIALELGPVCDLLEREGIDVRALRTESESVVLKMLGGVDGQG